MKLPVHFETPVAVQVALEVPPVCQLVGRALTAARTAQPAWAATPLPGRLKMLRRARGLLAERALDLANAANAN